MTTGRTTFFPLIDEYLSIRMDVDWASLPASKPMHDGNAFAKALFDRLGEPQRPKDLPAVDEYLRPIAETLIGLEAPPGPRADGWEPMITAEKS